MKKKIIWNNHCSNYSYYISCSSDYTDEQLIMEVPLGTSCRKFHELVDYEVYNYLVDVHNAIEKEKGIPDNINISAVASLVCNNLYCEFRGYYK